MCNFAPKVICVRMRVARLYVCEYMPPLSLLEKTNTIQLSINQLSLNTMKKLITLLALMCLMVTGAVADDAFRNHRYDTFKVMPINENSIVFVGNSITDMHLWAEAFGDNPNVVNRGNSGATSSEILANVRSYCAGHPAKIFLMIGINDKPNATNRSTIVSNIEQTIAAIRTESPNTKIYMQSILPSGSYSSLDQISACNTAIQNMLGSYPDVTYIDLYSNLVGKLDQGGNYSYDKLHGTAAVYQIWLETIKQYVNNTNRYPANTIDLMTKESLPSNSFGARGTYMSMMPISSDDILFFGDEMVKNGEWNELLGNIHVKNRGTNWDYDKTVSSMTYCRGDIEATFATVSGVSKTAPKQILLYTGTGEVNGNGDINSIVDTYKGLVSLLRTHASATSTKISLVGLMPTKGYDNSRVKQFNAALQSYAATATNVEYIDIYTALATNDQINTKYFAADNYYLTGDGYIKVAEILAQHIEGCTPVTATQANLYRAKIAGTEISLDEAFFEEGWYKIQVGNGTGANGYHQNYQGKYLYANPHDYVINSTTYNYAIGLADSGSDPTAYVYITGSHDQWHMEFNHGRDNSYFVTTNCLYDKTTPGNLMFIPNDETNPTQWKIWGSWPEAPASQGQGDYRWMGWDLGGPSVGATSQIYDYNNNCYFIFTKTDAPVYPEEEDPEEDPEEPAPATEITPGWYQIQIGSGTGINNNHQTYKGKYLYANPHMVGTNNWGIGLTDNATDPATYVNISGSEGQWHIKFVASTSSYYVTSNCLVSNGSAGNLSFIPNSDRTEWKIWGDNKYRWMGWDISGASVGSTSTTGNSDYDNCYFVFKKAAEPVYKVGKAYIIKSVVHGSYSDRYVLPPSSTTNKCTISTTKPTTADQMWVVKSYTDNGDGTCNVCFENNGQYFAFMATTTEANHSVKVSQFDVDKYAYVNIQDVLKYWPDKSTDNRTCYMAIKDDNGSVAWGTPAEGSSSIRTSGYSYQFAIEESEFTTVTYNFTVDGQSIGSKVVAEAAGQAPTVSVPDYVNIVSGMPTTIVAGTTSYDVETSYKSSVPFTVGNTYFIDDWGVSGRHYLLYSDGTNVKETSQTSTYYDISSYAGNSSYHWTVGGDWLNGFTFKNGDGYYMKAPIQNPSNGTALVVSTTDEPLCHFDLKASGATSGKYTYTPHGGTNNVAHTSNVDLKLSFYQSYTGANLEATTFTFIPVAPTLQDHHLYTIKGAFNNNTYAPLVCENNVIKAGAATATPETFVFLETTHQNNAGLTPLFNLGTAEGTGFFAYDANGTANTTKANAVAVAFPTSSTSLSGGVVWDSNGFKSGYFGMVGVINTNTYRSYVVQPSSQINFNTRDNNNKISASNTLGATNAWCMNYVIEEVKGYTVYDLVVEGTVSGVTYQGATGNCLTTASQVNGGYFVVKNGVTLNESDFNVAGVPSGYTASVAVCGTTITVTCSNDIATLQEKINTLLGMGSKIGTVGYPAWDNTDVTTLLNYIDDGVTQANYPLALMAYAAVIGTSDVVLPQAGHAYKLSVRSSDGTKRWYLKNVGGVSASESDAAVFVMGSSSRTDDYNVFFVTNDNREIKYLRSNGTIPSGTSAKNDTYTVGGNCDFHISPMVAASNDDITTDKKARFGTFCFKAACSHNSGVNGTLNVEEGTYPTIVEAENPKMNGTNSSAIEMTEVEYPYTKPTLIADSQNAKNGYFASIWLPFPMIVQEGVEVYKGTQVIDVNNNSYLNLEKVDTNRAVARGGYILYSEETSGEIWVQPYAGAPDDEHETADAAFYGSTENPGVADGGTEWSTFIANFNGVTPYVLSNKNAGIGFYKYTGTKLPKGKAIWMKPADASNAECVKFGFGDIISAIEALHGNTTNAEIYDLQGHRLDKVQKGQINVINGQKIMFK